MAKRKCYAIVRITIQREIEFEVDDEKEVETNTLIENKIEEQFGELNIDQDEPDEFEVLEFDYAE